ncbi:hypothetical protein BKI52_34430 [marine bacterium AO1-C]|nr:hypothetical protein BKI52_34430 [marine bacterium AO1-C]
MNVSFNKSLFLTNGLWIYLCLVPYWVQAQSDIRIKVGRIIDQATGRGLPNVRVLVRIPKTESGIKTKQPFRTRTDQDGFYRIPIEAKFPDSEITIENIEGYEPIGPENAIKEIAVRQVTSRSRNYELIVEGKNNQKIRKAYFIFNRNSFPFEPSGKFSFRTEAQILDLMPLEIEVQGVGKASGKFTVYKKGIGKDGKWLYWTRDQGEIKQTIKFKLPITESLQRYRVKNIRGEILKNYPIVLRHNGKKIYTNQEGYFSIQMKLDKSDIGNPRDEVDQVDGLNIQMHTTLATYKEKKIDSVKLNKGLKNFERGTKALKEERDSLLSELSAMKYETKISNHKIDYFEKKIQSFERKYLELINRFKKEVLAGLASNDPNMTIKDTIVNLDQFHEYLDYYKKAKSTQDRVRQAQVYTIVSVIVGLLAIVGLLFWSRRRNKQKNKVLKAQKALLESQKTELEQKKGQLEQQATTLEDQNTRLEKQTNRLENQKKQLERQADLIKVLLSEVKHRGGNDLIAIWSMLSNINLSINDAIVKKRLEKAKVYIENLIEVRNSLSYTFDREKQVGDQSSDQMQRELIKIANALFNFHFDEKNHPTFDLSLEVKNVNEGLFKLVSFCVFELINNACKYALKDNGTLPQKVAVTLKQEDEWLKLLVSNTGRGIEEIELFDGQNFSFDKLKDNKGMNIIRRITGLEQGSFQVRTKGIHSEVLEGSMFECSYKYVVVTDPAKVKQVQIEE